MILKYTTFQKLDLSPSSDEEVADTASVGSVRKSYPNPVIEVGYF
jgi:hypothetical protein